eukprot:CAMPEP_0194576066 /NCGR_PEP_ID=MMETSP0292-20121207/11316_1 /TAXON_ID=39354 /ORGANISM="Heterosigma akashiwo, Strain CCMP2393" /LENGTH=75 /DNA_ID=CAMNT_0039428013 /DNA_START=1374 /DNA_END=1597 /DNA_ORIENTATION=+
MMRPLFSAKLRSSLSPFKLAGAIFPGSSVLPACPVAEHRRLSSEAAAARLLRLPVGLQTFDRGTIDICSSCAFPT